MNVQRKIPTFYNFFFYFFIFITYTLLIINLIMGIRFNAGNENFKLCKWEKVLFCATYITMIVCVHLNIFVHQYIRPVSD